MTVISIALYWSIAIWGLVSHRPVLLYLFFASFSFGSVAVVPPAALGGLTIIPTSMTLVLIIFKTLTNESVILTAISSAIDPRRLGFLFAFWIAAGITTIFMPGLFAGHVMIVPIRGDVSTIAPLAPTKQNFSQFVYLTISVVAVFVFAQLFKCQQNRQVALQGILFGSIVTVATGALDYASQYIPIKPFLDIFRTATYSLLVDVEVQGAKRVVGLMPEASSFGNLSINMLCFLYFLRRGIRSPRIRDIYAPVVVILLVFCVWLSTSSAAYVGLALFFVVAGFEWLVRFLETRYSRLRRRHLGAEFSAVVLAVVSLASILLFKPSLLDGIIQIIDRMVFQKTQSDSFEERNMWTLVSLRALTDTYGIGVGVGATRTSNHIVAVLSSTGVLGALFYTIFIFQSLLRQAAPGDQEGAALASALRYAFVPPFIVRLLIGTSPDFGEGGAFTFGLLTAVGLGGLYSYTRRNRYVHSSTTAA
ncbi:hypothetical protein KHP60_24255 [Microvirga sp. 3-52]|uniref:hypothetical protein n=1 Tax=Microvirga sp. 3-52 TaxID=2792425 RepID=UPI001AD3F807|nr:hypothetical protein [Microvirga sp. 3-52]MBO1909341.1 hypothetical protein [Microvirga sp. 3-52]MBS7455404.1 hypothetical protein [Microvirga sp. 3-52]